MIYLITNNINNRRYIGYTTKSLDVRWYKHCKSSEYGSNTYLHKAIRKYGPESFTIEFLSEGFQDEEVMFIEDMNPEYNMTKGGDGGDTSLSPNYKTALLQRDLSGSNNPNFGKLGSSSPNFGKKRTPEQIEKYKKSYKGKRIPVQIDGVKYDSVISAARSLGRSERYVRLHDEINEWKY